jgi:hypothetical protein
MLPELFWFLGAFSAHLVTCLALFSLAWILPEGPADQMVGMLFDVLTRPRPLPLSSFVWGVAVAVIAGVWRRARGPGPTQR